MLTLKHIKGSTRLKHVYGLHRRGELDHQDAGFDGGPRAKRPHPLQGELAGVEKVALEVTLVSGGNGTQHLTIK